MRPWAICQSSSLAALLVAPGLALAECKAQDALYAMATDPAGAEATLTLALNPEPYASTDLMMVLTVAGQNTQYVFDPTQSQGYGSVFATPRDEDLQDTDFMLQFYQSDENQRLIPYDDTIPQSQFIAPDALHIAGLGSALWYATNGQDNPVLLPQEIWYLTACD